MKEVKEYLEKLGFEYDKGSSDVYLEFTHSNYLIVIFHDPNVLAYMKNDNSYLIINYGDDEQASVRKISNFIPFLKMFFKHLIRKNKINKLLGI